jgi:hypothetical protein
MRYLGNMAAGQTLNFLFPTNDSDGGAAAPTTAGTVSVYQDGNPTQSTTGVTYTPSFDGVVGVNLIAINTSDAFYAAGHDYTVVLTGAVIDGQPVNAVLVAFSIEHRYPHPDNIADGLLDRTNGVETGKTFRQAMRIVAAVLAGKVSGAATGTETFKGLDGSTVRVTVTTDPAGNRTNVNYS